MNEHPSYRKIWKVINFNIDEAGEILQINEKLGIHLGTVIGIHVSIRPSAYINSEIKEAGELSLSFNNQVDHTVHQTASYSPELLSEAFVPLQLNQNLDKNKRISGYYRDYNSLKNELGEFVTYKLNILLECSIKQES